MLLLCLMCILHSEYLLPCNGLAGPYPEQNPRWGVNMYEMPGCNMSNDFELNAMLHVRKIYYIASSYVKQIHIRFFEIKHFFKICTLDYTSA